MRTDAVEVVSANGPARAASPGGPDCSPDRFRQVLGHFCTGVTVVTGVDAGTPVERVAIHAYVRARCSPLPPIAVCITSCPDVSNMKASGGMKACRMPSRPPASPA